MRRTIVVISVLMLVGAAVNVLLAWVLPRCGPMYIELNAHPSNMEPLDRTNPAGGEFAADMTLTSFGRQRFHGWGYDREVIYATDGAKNRSIVRGRCGFPFRSLYGSDTTGPGLRNAIEVPDTPLLPTPPPYCGLHFLATGVLWPGFVLDTMIYAMLVGVIFIVPGKVRRAMRRRRGCCAACGYPVGTSAVCTECGSSDFPEVHGKKAN